MTLESPLVRISIRYCPKCRWQIRACWIAQELLTTFESEIEVTLCPAGVGTFEVYANESMIFSRKESGRFPEPKELKQSVRDIAFPGRDLGHSDR